MHYTSFFALLASLQGTQSLPHNPRSPFVVKERHPVPFGWVKESPANKSDTIELQIGLKQRVENAVERQLEEISDPKHRRYGQHLSASDVRNLIAPAEETLHLVQAWLLDHGISHEEHDFSAARDWVKVSVPIEKAEMMLGTTYSTFKHDDGSTLLRAPEWSLPAHLHDHIDVVQPTTSFMRPQPNAVLVRESWSAAEFDEQVEPELPALPANVSAAQIDELCVKRLTTPDCIRALYGTLDYTVQAADKNSVAHFNSLNETSYRKDIKKFLKRFRPEAVAVADTFPISVVDNANNDQGPYTQEQYNTLKNIEGTLDSEMILGIAWPTPFEAINVGGLGPIKHDRMTHDKGNEPWLPFLNYLLERDEVPNVISISYGDNEQTVPESYARRVCSAFAQLGARGVTVFSSSGDFGVGVDDVCVSNDGTKTRRFLPHFPASCPWVTAVSATEDFSPEVATTFFASGAGFSDYFPTPDYQKKTINAYTAGLNGLNDGLYNKAGRGYPDVAAQGDNVASAWGGIIESAGGTSAAAPIFAAVIALVNDALLAEGKPVLGFINPWLYGGGHKALTDVTVGSSDGCNTDGFPAKAGWDAVTGWGTPNFSKLVDAAFASAGGYSNKQ